MNTIPAIQTHYDGHHFRSRLEARWTVFFNHAGITWEYEPEGYELPSGRYLPDFWLPNVNNGVWFEVKGQEPNDRERQLASELAASTGHRTYITGGPIPPAPPAGSWWFGMGHDYRGFEVYMPDGGEDHMQEFLYANSIEFFPCPNPEIEDAYTAARTARFEHGETPRTRKEN